MDDDRELKLVSQDHSPVQPQMIRGDILLYSPTRQKSVTRPFLSQSPYLVGSGPFGPPISPV